MPPDTCEGEAKRLQRQITDDFGAEYKPTMNRIKAEVTLGIERLQAEAVESELSGGSGRFAARYGLTSEPMIINGDVAGSKRQPMVGEFQATPSGFDVMILSPRAAGVGLTITAANHVIHLSRWWNPAVEDQCNDRVYRIGQDKPVTVHVPLAVHPSYGETSFDLKLDALLERKRALSHGLLAPPESKGDVNELFFGVVPDANEGRETRESW